MKGDTSQTLLEPNASAKTKQKIGYSSGIANLGIIIVVIIVLLVIVVISIFLGRGGFNSQLQNQLKSTISKQGVGPDGQSTKLGLPSCEGNEFFSVSPVSMDQFAGIIPLGELGAGGHNFPTEFIMFGMIRTSGGSFEDATIYSLGDIYVTKINGSRPDSEDDRKGYGIEFAACEELRGGMGFTSLSDKLLEEFVEPFDFCQEHTVGGSATTESITYTLCEKSGLMIEVKAGEVIGGIEGGFKNTLNFGMHDLRNEPLDFANPGRWVDKILYAACPLNYFSDDVKTQLESRLGNISGDRPRTVEPICGEVEQDVAGTAQGAWFVEGTPVDPRATSDQSKHLSLAHDNVDPTRPVFVIGSSQKGIEMRKFFFEPESSGYINRDFADVTPGEIYCYNNLTAGLRDRPLNLSILLTMPNETTLHLGKNRENSCGTGPWKLDTYTVYER